MSDLYTESYPPSILGTVASDDDGGPPTEEWPLVDPDEDDEDD